MTTTVETERAIEEAALFLDGVLMDVRLSYWRGKAPLEPEDLGLTKSDVPDIVTLGRKLIVPREAMRAFERISARANFITDQFTFPFPTGHARFIPYSVLARVLEELESLRTQFQDRVEDFFKNYEEYRSDMMEKYPEFEKALAEAYMPESELKKRYHMTWLLYTVSLPKGIRSSAIKASDAKVESAARQKALEGATREYQREFERQIDEFLGSAVGSLRAAVGEKVLAVSERIQAGETVSVTALKGVREVIERFRTLNFVGDREVEDRLAELEKLIPESGKRFEDTAFKAQFAAALEKVASTVVESDISTVTGEYKRRIRTE